MDEDFIVVTTYDIENVEIEKHIGLVQGSTVRSRNFGSDILAQLKNVIGSFIWMKKPNLILKLYRFHWTGLAQRPEHLLRLVAQ